MNLVRKLGLGLFGLGLLTASLYLLPLWSSRVQAQPLSYAYEVIDPDANPQDCPPSIFDPEGTGQVLTVKEVAGGEFSTTTYYCLVPGSDYQFRSQTGGGHVVTVVGNNPGRGVWGTIGAGQGNPINISGVSIFNQYIPNPTVNPEIEQGNNNPGLSPIDRPGLTEEGQEGEEEEAPASCESAGGIAWLLCPVILATDSALNWLDTQIQSLLAVDENKYMNDDLRSAWLIIRNISYVVLIPIMLVMVIGTALGFEVFSAYTVKKALPRMAVAVIFITLSWYITSFLINLTNVIGGGILGLLTAPFEFNGNTVATLSLADLFAAQGGSFWQSILAQGTIAIGIAVVLWLFLAPLALILVTALLILLLRQMLIIALALVAPLAILAWIFPGNDKLWNMWWGAFSKLLMMFPLIMAVVAVGRIFAAILAGPFEDGGFDSIITPFLVLAAFILPYVFIPFTFRLAGGMFANLTGMLQDREKGVFARMRERRGEKIGQNTRPIKDRIANARFGASSRLNQAASNKDRGRLSRMGLRGASILAGGYRPDEQQSARTAEAAKRFNDAVGSGPDNIHRALTAKYAYDMGYDAAEGLELARTKDGKRQYKTLGGSWADEADVLEADRRWGKDRYFQQAAVSYEMRKATESGNVDNVIAYSGALAKSWGMSEFEAAGTWKGAGFQNQDHHLEFKHAGFKRNSETGELELRLSPSGAEGMVQEMFDKRSTYNLSQMNAHTINQLSEIYSTTDKAETKRQIEAIAETFVMGGGRVEGMVGEGDAEQPIITPQMPGQQYAPTTRTQGSAHVEEAVKQLADVTGVLQNRQQATGGTQASQAGQQATSQRPQAPSGPPPEGTVRDDDGNLRQSGGPGAGGVILGGDNRNRER